MRQKSNLSKIYIAAPLFNPLERKRNTDAATKLIQAGYEVFIPQVNSGEAKLSNKPNAVSRPNIFKSDVKGVYEADIILAFVDGRVPDEGTIFELGLGYGLNKVLIIVNEDDRSFMDGHMNLMIEESVEGNTQSRYFKTFEEALKYLALNKIIGGDAHEE